MMRINRPVLGDAELHEIASVLESGNLTQGAKAVQFERLVAERIGVEYAFAMSSCSTGLHMALICLGIGPGDEVIIPDFTFPATGNVVVECGATPVLADIDLATYCIDPAEVAARITPRTRAVMPVHAFGLCADMDAIRGICDPLGIPVIEDAACALGARFQERWAGSLGEAGVFSFHPRKIITTGEGGMLTTNNPDMASRISVLRTHGAVRGPLFLQFDDFGFNYRLSDIHAAVGVAQMARLETILLARRDLAAQYDEALGGHSLLSTPIVPFGQTHTYQSYVVLLEESLDRDAAIEGLRARGIETTLGTYSLNSQPSFRQLSGVGAADVPRSLSAFNRALTLPLHPGMSRADVEVVARELDVVLGALA